MGPANLKGLNIVHPVQLQDPSISDQQDILSAPPFPDLTAQLDLWTNLAFESDEPLHNDGGEKISGKKQVTPNDGEAEDDSGTGSPTHDVHEDVAPSRTIVPPSTTAQHGESHANFDLNNFLAGFGIDPFLVPPVQPAHSNLPSLAQLLSLQAHLPGAYPPSQSAANGRHPVSVQNDRERTESLPPAKRTRTRKSSVSTADSPLDKPITDSVQDGAAPMSASEDKRRRNTAASARFRLKKKEREAALEKKAKDMETRVNELERECEGLRRENGWLKGLVVGVTGASATPAPATQAGVKRPREETAQQDRVAVGKP